MGGATVLKICVCRLMMMGIGHASPQNTSQNVAKVHDAILQDRRRTIHNIRNIVDHYDVCQRTLSGEINMWRITAKFVSKLLSIERERHSVHV